MNRSTHFTPFKIACSTHKSTHVLKLILFSFAWVASKLVSIRNCTRTCSTAHNFIQNTRKTKTSRLNAYWNGTSNNGTSTQIKRKVAMRFNQLKFYTNSRRVFTLTSNLIIVVYHWLCRCWTHNGKVFGFFCSEKFQFNPRVCFMHSKQRQGKSLKQIPWLIACNSDSIESSDSTERKRKKSSKELSLKSRDTNEIHVWNQSIGIFGKSAHGFIFGWMSQINMGCGNKLSCGCMKNDGTNKNVAL